MDGWSKMQIFIRPTLRGCLKQGITPTHGYGCVASWYVYARKFAAGTMPIPYHEPFWDSLVPLLEPGQEGAFATCEDLWSDLPETFPDFVAGVVAAIKEMDKKYG